MRFTCRSYRHNVARALLPGLEILVAAGLIRTVVPEPTRQNVLAGPGNPRVEPEGRHACSNGPEGAHSDKKLYGFRLIPSHKCGPLTSLRVARPERNAVGSKGSGQTALHRSC